MKCCNAQFLSLPGSESASAPEPPTPHLDEASGGVPAQEGKKGVDSELQLTVAFVAGGAGSNSQRRASVTVSGSGGLTGLIQSALNQVGSGKFTMSSVHAYDMYLEMSEV